MSTAGSWAFRGIPPLLMILGAALIIESVLNGSSRFALFLIIPVVTGNAPVLLIGVVLLLIGFFLLPLALSSAAVGEDGTHRDDGLGDQRPGPRSTRGDVPPRSGGLVLIGPVPILFGSFRGLRRRYVLLLSALGAILLLTLVLLATLG